MLKVFVKMLSIREQSAGQIKATDMPKQTNIRNTTVTIN